MSSTGRGRLAQYLLDIVIVLVLVVWTRFSVTWLGKLVAILFALGFFITRMRQQCIRSKFSRDVYVDS